MQGSSLFSWQSGLAFAPVLKKGYNKGKHHVEEDIIMAYITVQQAAAQWHCAADWLERLCQSGRLPGAVERADGWYIPADTTPPPHTAHLPMPL